MSKKNLAKLSDTCFIRADGLCIRSPRLVGGRKARNSNMQEFFAPCCMDSANVIHPNRRCCCYWLLVPVLFISPFPPLTCNHCRGSLLHTIVALLAASREHSHMTSAKFPPSPLVVPIPCNLPSYGQVLGNPPQCRCRLHICTCSSVVLPWLHRWQYHGTQPSPCLFRLSTLDIALPTLLPRLRSCNITYKRETEITYLRTTVLNWPWNISSLSVKMFLSDD